MKTIHLALCIFILLSNVSASRFCGGDWMAGNVTLTFEDTLFCHQGLVQNIKTYSALNFDNISDYNLTVQSYTDESVNVVIHSMTYNSAVFNQTNASAALKYTVYGLNDSTQYDVRNSSDDNVVGNTPTPVSWISDREEVYTIVYAGEGTTTTIPTTTVSTSSTTTSSTTTTTTSGGGGGVGWTTSSTTTTLMEEVFIIPIVEAETPIQKLSTALDEGIDYARDYTEQQTGYPVELWMIFPTVLFFYILFIFFKKRKKIAKKIGKLAHKVESKIPGKKTEDD